MMMGSVERKFKFEKLVVWQRAMDLGEQIHLVTRSFPIEERFNLSSQLMRSIDSVALNISEGSIGQSNAEQKRFIGYSIRSLAEAVTCLHKAKRRNYISSVNFNEHTNQAHQLMNMLIGFRNKIN